MRRNLFASTLAAIGIAVTIAAAPSALAEPAAATASAAIASPGGGATPQIREDCQSGQACGWLDAYFANGWYAMVGTGNFYPAAPYNNSISSIRNVHSGASATYYDYSGSSNFICLNYNYEVGNLASTALDNKISYIQVSGYAC